MFRDVEEASELLRRLFDNLPARVDLPIVVQIAICLDVMPEFSEDELVAYLRQQGPVLEKAAQQLIQTTYPDAQARAQIAAQPVGMVSGQKAEEMAGRKISQAMIAAAAFGSIFTLLVQRGLNTVSLASDIIGNLVYAGYLKASGERYQLADTPIVSQVRRLVEAQSA